MNNSGEVIVVGAGPVGLITALGLARAGIKVTVIEAQEKINDSPRAAVYFPMTLEFLDSLGVIEDAVAAGVRNDALRFKRRADGSFVDFSASVLEHDTDYPYRLHFGQDVLAGIVQKHLLALPNTELNFNSQLNKFSQDDEGVTLSIDSAAGERQLHCDWLVAADGARSTVRNALNLEFEGHTWPERFVATNIYFDEFQQHDFGLANFYMDPTLWAVIAIINQNNLWRVTYNEDADISDQEALARIPQRLAVLLPGSGNYQLDAAAPYRVHERACKQFRAGRVMLAGDAAHVCNPCGGLGLTTGIMDARALIDALTAVIYDAADESILDCYAQERRRVFLEITSPRASENKRMISEADSARQKQDFENLRHVASDPDALRQAMLAAYNIQGRSMVPAP